MVFCIIIDHRTKQKIVTFYHFKIPFADDGLRELLHVDVHTVNGSRYSEICQICSSDHYRFRRQLAIQRTGQMGGLLHTKHDS